MVAVLYISFQTKLTVANFFFQNQIFGLFIDFKSKLQDIMARALKIKLMRLASVNRIDVVDSNLKSESEHRIIVDSIFNE